MCARPKPRATCYACAVPSKRAGASRAGTPQSEQIGPLREDGRCPHLVSLLEYCCADEVLHKGDAQARAGGPPRTLVERAWVAIVKTGSALAAEVARRV